MYKVWIKKYEGESEILHYFGMCLIFSAYKMWSK